MNSKKWLLLVMCALMVLLFVGCEAAEAVPQPRDLIVVNGTTDAEIVEIEVDGSPFGQRKIDMSAYFYLYDEKALQTGDSFAILFAPYVYRLTLGVGIEFVVEDPSTGFESTGYDRTTVVIDLPEVSENPVVVTVVNDGNIDFPGYTIEVTGDYVAYDVPNTK